MCCVSALLALSFVAHVHCFIMLLQGNKVPNLEMGYPGGIFDPLGEQQAAVGWLLQRAVVGC